MKIDYSIYINEAFEIYDKQRVKSIVKVAEKLHKKYKIKTPFATFRRGLSGNFKRKNKTVKQVIKKVVKKTIDEDAKPFVLDAWSDKGYIMNIDEFCKTHTLPREDVKTYRLCTHTKVRTYNITFN